MSVGRRLMGLEAPPPRKREAVTLLPDPAPRRQILPIVSVDDHIVEPPDMFEGRLPRHLQPEAPRLVEDDTGQQMWHLEHRVITTVGLSATVGRAHEDWDVEPTRFDEMRPGCYDIDHRIKDMDIAGIAASVGFPSALPGFAGRMFARCRDQELGLALVRAWNDWHAEVWAGSHPGRIIPCQLPWLNDVDIAAAEIRRNAERGFRAVTFTEMPSAHGLPSLHSGHWDPFLAACEETGTVVCLHAGSSGWTPVTAPDAPSGQFVSSFTVNAFAATVEWLWSGVAVRFPALKVAMSESGVSWLPALIERLEFVAERSMKSQDLGWVGGDLRPVDVLRRNFWFSSLSDPVGMQARELIGTSQLLLESDYPHADSTWPDTQDVVAQLLQWMPADEAAMIAHRNAEALFNFPLSPITSEASSCST